MQRTTQCTSCTNVSAVYPVYTIYVLYNICHIILMYHLLHIETTPRANSSTRCKILCIQSTCNSYIILITNRTSYLLRMSDLKVTPQIVALHSFSELHGQAHITCILHCLHHRLPCVWEVASSIFMVKPFSY